jgi:hypothetical protein
VRRYISAVTLSYDGCWSSLYIICIAYYFKRQPSYQDFLDRGLLLTWKLLNQGFLLVKLKSSLVVNTSRSFPHSRLITEFITWLTRRVPLKEQELLTLPEHTSYPPVFSVVLVIRSLVLYICFVNRCLSFCTFSFGHCVVCSSSIYRLWLPLWYLQTLLPGINYVYLTRVSFTKKLISDPLT